MNEEKRNSEATDPVDVNVADLNNAVNLREVVANDQRNRYRVEHVERWNPVTSKRLREAD